MSNRWTTDDVWALAPDSTSRKAAVKTAKPDSWSATGFRPADTAEAAAVWGDCAGSGKTPYRVMAELGASPAYRCSCPSRKTPCKHTLALLYLWADTGFEVQEPPEHVAEWLSRRAAARNRPAAAAAPADPAAAARRAEKRHERVSEGVAELDLWLRDQLETGLAGSRDLGYSPLDTMAARLVDSQAGRLADRVRDISRIGTSRDWPDRMLSEYAMLHMLSGAYQRRADLDPALRATVETRVGLPTAADETAPVRDHWQVLGMCDFGAGQVRGRRIWLRGAATGRTAALLSFAPEGQTPETPVRAGTSVDADLAFHPAEWRASVAAVHAEQPAQPPAAGGVVAALDSYAAALAADPWLDAWPVALDSVRVAADQPWALADPTGAVLPLLPECSPNWRLAAVSGGAPTTVVGEWTGDGLRPLTAWDTDGRSVALNV
ncbi:SWIM zinc finger family protein [Streptomonospora sediminis]